MNNSLYAFIQTELKVEVDSTEAVYIFAESVLYLVGCSSAFEYQNYLKPLSEKRSAKSFRLALLQDRYFILELKLFALQLAKLEDPCSKNVRKLAKSLGIAENDYQVLSILFEENRWFAAQIRKALRSIGKNNPLLEVSAIEDLFQRVYMPVMKYVKFLTYKKLKFLVKSENASFEEFNSDLSVKVVQAFYSIMPVKATELHIVNYLKRVVHNHTVNIIKAHTSQKRGRLVKTGTDKHNDNTFSLLCVSQNQANLGTETDGTPIDVTDVADTSSSFELKFSISELLNSFKLSGKKHRFVTLLMGTEDEEFTKWLRREGVCKPSEDNADVQERVSANAYNAYIAEFLNISYRKAESFVTNLREFVEA